MKPYSTFFTAKRYLLSEKPRNFIIIRVDITLPSLEQTVTYAATCEVHCSFIFSCKLSTLETEQLLNYCTNQCTHIKCIKFTH